MRNRPLDRVALATVSCALALAGCGSSAKPVTGAASNYTSFLNFSKCMRAHGVPDFPDPHAGGGIKIALGSGTDPRSPTFQSASQSCKHLLPGGGPPATVPESTKLAMLRHAECMRLHGVPGYADPIFPKGGGIESFVPSSVDINSPAFRRAAKVCGGA